MNKVSDCCGARVGANQDLGTICDACQKPCTIASKPDASPDRLLSKEEITKCYKRTKFPTPGAVEKQICLAQDAKTYPIAFEAGREEGQIEGIKIAHDDIKRMGVVGTEELKRQVEAGKKQGGRELAEWVENWAENTGHSDVQLQAKIRELL